MKKRVTIVLEVESEDELNLTDEFIETDIKAEIKCTSNFYDIKSIQITEII